MNVKIKLICGAAVCECNKWADYQDLQENYFYCEQCKPASSQIIK